MSGRWFPISIFLLCTLTLSAFAQNKADTISAAQFYKKGEAFLKAKKFDSAEVSFEKASLIYRNLGLREEYVNGLNRTTKSFLEIGQLDKALKVAEKALTESRQYFGEEHLLTATVYDNLGVHAANQGQGEMQEGIRFHLKALNIRLKKPDENQADLAFTYLNVGLNYRRMGNHKVSLKYLLKTSEVQRKTLGVDHPDLVTIYFNLGIAFKNSGDFVQSLERFRIAEQILLKAFGPYHPMLGDTYDLIGLTLTNQEDYKGAMDYYLKSLEIYSKVFGSEHLHIAYVYSGIGILHYFSGEFEKAYGYYLKSLKLKKNLFGDNHLLIAKDYSNIAKVLIDLENDDKARDYIEKGSGIFKRRSIQKHVDLGRFYLYSGRINFLTGNYPEALSQLQKALNSNVLDFNNTSVYTNPEPNNFLDQDLLLTTLTAKALYLEKLFYEHKKLTDLQFSVETLQVADALIDQLRQSHQRFEDQLEIGKASQEIYKSAVRISNLVYSITSDNEYRKLAFHFAEKSRGLVILQNLTNNLAKSSANLPDSLLQLEQRLKVDQSFNQSQVLELKRKNNDFDTVKMVLYQNRFFDVNQKLDSLTLIFEQNYPGYFQQKHQNKILDLSAIQEKLLPNQALLEYFDGDSMMYVFTIRPDEFSTNSFVKDSTFLKTRDQYLESLSFSLINDEPEKAYAQFVNASNSLYEKLLAPALSQLPSSVNHLVIVPTGKLSNAPWDIFAMNKPDTSKSLNYKDLGYLLSIYSVSYAHSASHLFQNIYSDKRSKQSVLAFAALYPSTTNDESYSDLSSAFRDDLLPLKWNQAEISEIGKYFDGLYLTGTQATEKLFKEEADNYRIIHLAMHALVDNEKPMLSKLVFSQVNSSTEDGMLHPHELLNMNLSAEMAVLSACNTNLGKIQQGEGVMSLGWAFSYAGCPSVVLSHWSVNDKSTSELMGYFYKNIARGQSKHTSLRNAKLSFLENNHGVTTHPYYWGSFMVLGNTDPINISETQVWWYVLLAIGIAIALFYFRNRLKSKTAV